MKAMDCNWNHASIGATSECHRLGGEQEEEEKREERLRPRIAVLYWSNACFDCMPKYKCRGSCYFREMIVHLCVD